MDFAVVCPCLPWPGNMADTPRVGLRVDLVVEAGLNFCWLEAIHLCNRLGKRESGESEWSGVRTSIHITMRKLEAHSER